jgi:type I restriction enzyme, R subunit
MDKRTLSESDICDLFITPAIRRAGWDPMTQIRREVTLTPGPVVVRGNVASRNKKKSKFADYVLYQEPGVPIAVVEAKDSCPPRDAIPQRHRSLRKDHHLLRR